MYLRERLLRCGAFPSRFLLFFLLSPLDLVAAALVSSQSSIVGQFLWSFLTVLPEFAESIILASGVGSCLFLKYQNQVTEAL